MSDTVKFLGNTDEVTTCDCCGRSDLKSTVALSINDAEPVYYGVICAAQALRSTPKDVRSAARKADKERHAREAAAREAAWGAKSAPWFAFLAARGAGDDNFRRIESLGGYKAARALFEANK